MVRYLTEADVRKLLAMPLALQCIEKVNRAIGVRRTHIHPPTGTQHVLQAPGRSSGQQITLYESHGMGLQDVYVGAKILELARARGIGQDMSIGG